MKVKIQLKDENSQIPKQANEYDAGFDLIAHSWLAKYSEGNYRRKDIHLLNFGDRIPIHPKERLLIGTGLYMAVPKGCVLDIRSRSGLALKKGLVVCNSPGTIDSGYRGEVGVILLNTSGKTEHIIIGEKIAQGVLLKHEVLEDVIVAKLSITERGKDGFGSSDDKN